MSFRFPWFCLQSRPHEGKILGDYKNWSHCLEESVTSFSYAIHPQAEKKGTESQKKEDPRRRALNSVHEFYRLAGSLSSQTLVDQTPKSGGKKITFLPPQNYRLTANIKTFSSKQNYMILYLQQTQNSTDVNQH